MAFYTLVLGPIAVLIVYLLSNYFKPGLRSIPGPWAAKFTDLYRLLLVWNGRYSHDVANLHKKYGPYVRLGPNLVSISDRHVIDDIYGIRTNLPKSDWVKTSQPLYEGKVVPALMTTQDKAVHTELKRPIAGAYSVTNLRGFETSVEDTIRLFFRRLDEEFIYPQRSCNIHDWLQFCAYDVIGVITMSRPMGFMAAGEDIDNILGLIKKEANYRAITAQMPILDWIIRKNPIVRRFGHPTHRVMIRAKKMLNERLTDTSEKDELHRDFIYRFHEAKEKHPDVLSDSNMLGFVGSNLQAGSDTTAIVLRTILYHLLKNPDKLKKLREELDNCGFERPIPFQNAFNELPYTDAVIREALRIHSPFALLLERVVQDQGLELPNGRLLPPNTIVGMFGYTVHHDKEIFGEDVDAFNPDRWLQRKDESTFAFQNRINAMKKLDFAFGHGSRSCLGKHIAELQLYKIVPAMFEFLDIAFVNPLEEWKVEERFFAVQSNMNVTIKWREGKDKMI